jgi:hypothetical protein
VQFLWGVVGGVAPEILRLWRLRDEVWTPTRHYFPLSVALALLAGAMAVAFAATTPLAALYVGVSTPYLISTMVAAASAGSSKGPAQEGVVPDKSSQQSETAGSGPDVNEIRVEDAGSPSFRQRMNIFMRTLLR